MTSARRTQPSSNPEPSFSTERMLIAQYAGRPIIPIDDVRKDWFPHLTLDVFQRKLSSGDIALPVIRIEASQKSPKGVHLGDLAIYLEERRKEASKVLAKMSG